MESMPTLRLGSGSSRHLQPEKLGSTSGHPDEPEPSYPAAFSRINKRLPYLLQSSSYAAKPDARVFFVCNRWSEEQKTNTTVARVGLQLQSSADR